MHSKIENNIVNHLHILENLLEDGTGNISFKNDVFQFNSYWFGDCNCNFHLKNCNNQDDDCYCECAVTTHAEECRAGLPNFKCGDFEARWYKHIGRGMEFNKDISRADLLDMMKKCLNSIK